MIESHGKPETPTRDIETIILEGRAAKWSSRQIASAVRSHVVATLVTRYRETEPCFLDRGDIVEFEKFLNKSIQINGKGE